MLKKWVVIAGMPGWRSPEYAEITPETPKTYISKFISVH